MGWGGVAWLRVDVLCCTSTIEIDAVFISRMSHELKQIETRLPLAGLKTYICVFI